MPTDETLALSCLRLRRLTHAVLGVASFLACGARLRARLKADRRGAGFYLEGLPEVTDRRPAVDCRPGSEVAG